MQILFKISEDRIILKINGSIYCIHARINLNLFENYSLDLYTVYHFILQIILEIPNFKQTAYPLSNYECIYPSINDPDPVFRPSPGSTAYARVLHLFFNFLPSIICLFQLKAGNLVSFQRHIKKKSEKIISQF